MIKPQDIIWQQTKYLRIGQTEQYEFELALYKPLYEWDVFDYWERERTRDMRKKLQRGDILFDVGAEVGWLSVIYGQMVGASNMVLIEPTPEFWPNIEALWKKNFDAEPLACYLGFFSNTTSDSEVPTDWPKHNGDLIEKLGYNYIHSKVANVPEITLDEYVKQTGIVPNAVTIDVEGAELLVLQGAEDTLMNKNIKLWVSIHPDLALRDYGVKDRETVEYLEHLGYAGRLLATDHEQHWYFSKDGKL